MKNKNAGDSRITRAFRWKEIFLNFLECDLDREGFLLTVLGSLFLLFVTTASASWARFGHDGCNGEGNDDCCEECDFFHEKLKVARTGAKSNAIFREAQARPM